MAEGKPIALFDIDGTLIRSSLLIEVFRGFIREGVFPPLADREIAEHRLAWHERRSTRAFTDYAMEVVRVFYRRICGVSMYDAETVGRMVADEQYNQVYVYTRNRIEELRRTHHCVAISGSPDIVVRPFAEAWGFARVFASDLDVDARTGRYTGGRAFGIALEHKVDLSAEKRVLFERACSELGVVAAGSYGFGDTESDLGFLDCVEHPVAFNPNRELYAIAHERRWPIVIERKNVIVQLHDGRYEVLAS